MRRGKIFIYSAAFSVTAVLMVLVHGCTKSEDSLSASASGVPVTLTASFSKSAPGVPLFKGTGTEAADSIRIDSLVVVVEKIKFYSHVDTVAVDTTEHDDHGEREEDASFMFRGPFVIWVRDTLAVDFASKLLPAGTYDGIKFKIHRLRLGERHEDSDKHRHIGIVTDDSSIVGSSIVVWGAVLKNGTWTPFTLKADMELEFKIKGNFVVPEAIGGVRIAVNFNLGLWFKDPATGAFLDPTDPSMRTKDLIRRAIRFAFGKGRGGHDFNHDGHPDD